MWASCPATRTRDRYNRRYKRHIECMYDSSCSINVILKMSKTLKLLVARSNEQTITHPFPRVTPRLVISHAAGLLTALVVLVPWDMNAKKWTPYCRLHLLPPAMGCDTVEVAAYPDDVSSVEEAPKWNSRLAFAPWQQRHRVLRPVDKHRKGSRPPCRAQICGARAAWVRRD